MRGGSGGSGGSTLAGSGNVETIVPFIVEASRSNRALPASVSVIGPLIVFRFIDASDGKLCEATITFPLTLCAVTDATVPSAVTAPLTV